MSEVYWKIVFTKEDGLVAACMQDFDVPDYDIAIDKAFDNEAEAEFAAIALNAIRDPIDLLRAVRKLESY